MKEKIKNYLNAHPRILKVLKITKIFLILVLCALISFIAVAGIVYSFSDKSPKLSNPVSRAISPCQSSPFPEDTDIDFSGLLYWHGQQSAFPLTGIYTAYSFYLSSNIPLSAVSVYTFNDGAFSLVETFNCTSLYVQLNSDWSRYSRIEFAHIDDPTTVSYSLFDPNYYFILTCFPTPIDGYPNTYTLANDFQNNCIHLNPSMLDTDSVFQAGYAAGRDSAQSQQLTNPVTFIISSVEQFFSIKVFGVVSLGVFLSVGIFISIALIFLKMFAGG